METPTPSSPSEVRPEDLIPPPLPFEWRDGLHVKGTLARAGDAAMKLTDQIVEAGQAHPRTAAAVLLGTGMLLGSLMYRLAQPPTTTQRITRALKRGAIGAGRLVFGGIDSARHFPA
jgi:hypothetical protein